MSSSPLSGSGGSGPSPGDLFETARNLSIGDAVQRGITTNILAAMLSVASLITAGFDVVISGLDTLGQNLGAIPSALFSGGADLIGVGAVISGRNLGQFGVLAIVGATVLVLVTLWLFLQFLQEPETGNLLPGIPIDIPVFGAEEEEE